MKSKGTLGVMEVLQDLPDPRSRKCPYPLEEILLTAICAVLSGAEDWCSVAAWGRLKLEWLRKWLPYEQGIASHDTFRRIFCLLKAEQFESNFITWMKTICPSLTGKHVAIDGKTVRGSRNGEQRGIHLVSAWCSEYGMTLGQICTEEKSNEITAIPKLIDSLAIEGATVTIDAMGCQHSIAEKIIAHKADYILAVKDNQKGLSEAIQDWFRAAETGKLDRPFWQTIEHDKGHGRIETRRCVVTNDVGWLAEQGQHWTQLQSLTMIESTREIGSKKSVERRYYISSLPAKPAPIAQKIRSHWGIENNMHWVLDMAFREDDCRLRTDDAAENFSILRRLALNLLKQDTATKLGVKNRRLKAGWDTNYLGEILGLHA